VIQSILSSASDKILRKATAPRDFSRAVVLIDKMRSAGQLNEVAVVGFATAGKYEELIVALAVLSTASVELIERLMQNVRHDGILVACKAAELRWQTFNAILRTRFGPHDLPMADLTQARTDFLKLSVPTARRMLRFWLVRGATKPDA
jgi:hypothetical protein